MPTLIVPDEQTWTMLGLDPAGLGAEPSFRAASTVAVLRPAHLPAALAASLDAYIESLPGGVMIESVDLAMPSPASAQPRSSSREDGAEGHAVEMGHGHHGEGDMMAIVGEPSADGLIMETLELRHGPLGVPLPGGITIAATLDGDVITEVEVGGIRVAENPRSAASEPSVPDPLSPLAWTIVIAATKRTDGPTVTALELERAISHLAWLRSLGRLLGWSRLTRLTASAIVELSAIDTSAPDRGGTRTSANARLEVADDAVSRILALLRRSRSLRWRLAGRGVVGADRAESLGLTGPNARASGLPRDARRDDPRYVELGFEPLSEIAGDAASRTLMRAREAQQSIRLIGVALGRESTDDQGSRGLDGQLPVEGPRGPLHAERSREGWSLRAPGSASARTLAAELMVGERWEDALAVLASFDLSPWEVDP